MPSGEKNKSSLLLCKKNLSSVTSMIYIKNEEQIEGIRKSSQLTKKLLDMVEDRIAEGVTTNEIDQWVHSETLANGQFQLHLITVTVKADAECLSQKASVPHLTM